MRFLDRFRSQRSAEHADAAQSEESEPEEYCIGYRSAEGEKHGASNIPLIFYGHMAQVAARSMANDTTVTCVAVAGLDMLVKTLTKIPSIGLIARSRTTHVGEAEEAIRRYRQHAEPPVMALYGAWDYHVERAAQRAIGCGADGIEMPGIATGERYAYILGVLGEVWDGAAIPTTVDEHVARLKRYTTDRSPFWGQQDLVVSRFY